MARPKKKNADYFPHDADMRNDPKIRALRRKFGIKGYAVWNMMLEVLTDCDFFEYQWNRLNIELLAGDFDIDPKVLEEMVKYCQEVNLLTTDGDKIFTPKLKERFESLLNRRTRQRNEPTGELSTVITTNKIVSGPENPQSKGKESKVNITNSNKDFDADVYKSELGSENNQMWKESWYMKFKVKPNSLSQVLDKFNIHLGLKDKTELPKHLKDYKEHFYNWCNVQERIGNLDDYKKGKKQGAL